MMLSNDEKAERKQVLLEKCFELFTKQGLENTSINDLANYCNTYKSSLYNFFESKDEIVLESAKMYMAKLDDMFFKAFLNPKETLTDMLKYGFEMIANEKSGLRFIYQVVSSPLFGERAQIELSSMYMKYLDYSDIFAQIYKVGKTKFRSLFLLFISTMHDYCMWGNEILVKEKLDYIYGEIVVLKEKNVKML